MPLFDLRIVYLKQYPSCVFPKVIKIEGKREMEREGQTLVSSATCGRVGMVNSHALVC